MNVVQLPGSVECSVKIGDLLIYTKESTFPVVCFSLAGLTCLGLDLKKEHYWDHPNLRSFK